MSKRRPKKLLQAVFFHVVSKYCRNKKFIYKKWNKIMFNYRNNLRPVQVLTNFITEEQFFINIELERIEEKLLKILPFTDDDYHRDSLILAIYYSKIIKNEPKSGNRKNSAHFGKRHMKSMNIPKDIIKKSINLILSKAV